MSNYNRVRGTVDLYGLDMLLFKQLEQTLFKISNQYHFKMIQTPIFEEAKLFQRTAGDSSDLVSKEMYLFKDKGDRLLALRPEGTAGVIRAVVEEKMLNNNPYPLKLMYFSSCFRYERPQSGRQRQFHQFGVELLNANSIYDDFEVISLADQILKQLKIVDYNLEINYISTPKQRLAWINALKTYFYQYYDQLTLVSQQRLETNVLRILDDKEEAHKDFVKNAPKISAFISQDEQQEFDQLLKLLDQANIKYQINYNLVRGLDYYEGVVFEFVSTANVLVGQSTLIGGGRYGSLVSELNGPNVQGVGFGLGVERILIMLKYYLDQEQTNQLFKKDAPVYLVGCLDANLLTNLNQLVHHLRANSKLVIESNYNSYKIDKLLKQGERINAQYLLLLAPTEFANNQIIVRNLVTKTQQCVDYHQFIKENIDNE
ncbi:histidyl-tRNA synthase [Ureaplasma diversum]|uniref:Histidine--tRNA ligase n=1 Tax=Ureaplasma diversum TaxID=42094 RepID=A0A0C5RM46_9BACT|nr:histidine--tRNA ligase [Ureaplasma diversum]AJQ45477.1 histidyl-tRNA synthase [Ureaplasma diversum]